MNNKLLMSFVERAADLRVTNIVVHQNGERISEHNWDEEIRRNQ
jgi:hypothetical protein